jgi:hypothetical protein
MTISRTVPENTTLSHDKAAAYHDHAAEQHRKAAKRALTILLSALA